MTKKVCAETHGYRLLPIPASAISEAMATSPSLKNGLDLRFKAWHNPPIFKDVGAVNVGKSPALTPLSRQLELLLADI